MTSSIRTRSVSRAAAALLSLIAAGCDESPAASDVDSSVPVDASSGEVDYHAHVRPLLAEHCVGCHSPGAIGPFALDTYEAARPLAARIAAAARDRTMPPWLADNSGECGTFRDARWLREDEIATLEAWRDQGAPEGDPSTPAPQTPTLPTLSGDISSLDIGAAYVPNRAQPDDYRCFVVDAPIADTDYYATGALVRPGDPRVVHHVIVYAPYSDEAADEARARDAAEEGLGYTCFGGAGVDSTPAALWAPGAGATIYPRGTGIELRAGRPLVVQVHYNTGAVAEDVEDRTTVDLQLVTRGVTPAYWVPIADFDMELAPRMSSVSTTATVRLRDFIDVPVPLRIFGTGPHMHTLGRTMRVTHEPVAEGAEDACLLEVPRWDFDWQMAYFYETPIRVSLDDRITITCSYDTSNRTETVRWGEGTSDEMCIDFLYVSL